MLRTTSAAVSTTSSSSGGDSTAITALMADQATAESTSSSVTLLAIAPAPSGSSADPQDAPSFDDSASRGSSVSLLSSSVDGDESRGRTSQTHSRSSQGPSRSRSRSAVHHDCTHSLTRSHSYERAPVRYRDRSQDRDRRGSRDRHRHSRGRGRSRDRYRHSRSRSPRYYRQRSHSLSYAHGARSRSRASTSTAASLMSSASGTSSVTTDVSAPVRGTATLPAPFKNGKVPSGKPKASHYEPRVAKLVNHACHQFEVLLATEQPFPEPGVSVQWATRVWTDVCHAVQMNYVLSDSIEKVVSTAVPLLYFMVETDFMMYLDHCARFSCPRRSAGQDPPSYCADIRVHFRWD